MTPAYREPFDRQFERCQIIQPDAHRRQIGVFAAYRDANI